MNDIVIPYKSSYSEELKYVLRSVENLKHRNVVIVGDQPRFKTGHIPFNQTTDIAKNTLDIINLVINADEVSESFVWWHDDQFVLSPIKKLPIHHRGSYKDIIKGYNRNSRYNYYIKRMETTYRRLLSLGIADPLCYELHIPFVIDKEKWRKVSKHITPEVNKISIYANLNNLGGTKIRDVKVRSKDTVPDGNFISTHDSTFNTNQAGRLIRETFNKKGRYEY